MNLKDVIEIVGCFAVFYLIVRFGPSVESWITGEKP